MDARLQALSDAADKRVGLERQKACAKRFGLLKNDRQALEMVCQRVREWEQEGVVLPAPVVQALRLGEKRLQG